MEEIFRINAEGLTNFKTLYRNEAPEWFSYHGIEKDSVRVRSMNMRGNAERPQLGHPDRYFFDRAFNHLDSVKNEILKGKM